MAVFDDGCADQARRFVNRNHDDRQAWHGPDDSLRSRAENTARVESRGIISTDIQLHVRAQPALGDVTGRGNETNRDTGHIADTYGSPMHFLQYTVRTDNGAFG